MKDYNNSAVIPPPLPVTAVAELAEAAEVPPPLAVGFVVSPFDKPAEPNFRIAAIRKLKSSGAVFDEYDIEFEMESLRSAYLAELELKLESELKLRRAREEAAALRAEAEAKESLLRAARESAEASAREAVSREKKRDLLIGIAILIVLFLLILLYLLASHGWSLSSLFRPPESWERYL